VAILPVAGQRRLDSIGSAVVLLPNRQMRFGARLQQQQIVELLLVGIGQRAECAAFVLVQGQELVINSDKGRAELIGRHIAKAVESWNRHGNLRGNGVPKYSTERNGENRQKIATSPRAFWPE
jgi:hypothetical protein